MAMRKLLMRWLMLVLSSTTPNWTLDQLLCTLQLKVTMSKLFTLCCRMGQTQTRHDKARAIDGATPLLLAAQNGHPEVVNMLVYAGVDIDKAKTNTGAMPLSIAAQNGHVDVARSLLENGANTNKARALDGQNPLHIAAAKGHLDVCWCLLETAGSNSVARLAPCEKGAFAVYQCISWSWTWAPLHHVCRFVWGHQPSRPGFTIHNPIYKWNQSVFSLQQIHSIP